MVGVVSMVLAMTTVNVAVPDVMGAFGIGQDKAQWMSSAYTATMTAGMLINAWITGVLGERRTFVGALFFFSIGALLGGMAPTEDALIFSRILQGFSAGVAQPLVMAIIFTVFPAERRGMAMGVFGLGVVFAPAIGPTLGGMMIEYFSWRYVFYISLPFCVIAAVLGLLFMPTPAAAEGDPAVRLAGLRAALRGPARADDRHCRRPARGLEPPTRSSSGSAVGGSARRSPSSSGSCTRRAR